MAALAACSGVAGCKSNDTPASPSGDNPAASGAASAPVAAPGAGALSALLGTGFEGEVDFTFTNKEEANTTPVAATILVKGPKARLTIPPEMAKAAANPFAANAYVILDGDAKKLSAVLDARKEVVVVDLNRAGQDMGPMAGGHPGGAGAAGEPTTKIAKTGQFETIAGYKCEDWTVTSDHKEAIMCVADQGFSWFNFPTSGMPGDRLWAAELLDGKHFPLRFVAYGQDGTTEKSRVEVTKLEKKTEDAAQFTYPPTYTVMDVGQMMRAFGGGTGGMGGTPGRHLPPGMPPGMMPPGMMPPGMASAMPPHGKPN
jgi:hypothetical protein